MAGPTRDLFALLTKSLQAGQTASQEAANRGDEAVHRPGEREHAGNIAAAVPLQVLPVAVSSPAAEFAAAGDDEVAPQAPTSAKEQNALRTRDLRYRFRRLENERALQTVDGTAIWIITDKLSFNPGLGERVNNRIVGQGLGKGRIIYGPPDFCLPPGYYVAIIEFQVTSMLGVRRLWVAGEVSLCNQRYLSQQKKVITATGSYIFRLPFTVREKDLLEYSSPTVEVRLNVQGVIGVVVSQVAVLYKAGNLFNFFECPGAHLKSAGNAMVRWLGKKLAKPRT